MLANKQLGWSLNLPGLPPIDIDTDSGIPGTVYDVGRQIIQGGKDAHIPFQNEAHRNIASIVEGYLLQKNASNLTNAYIDNAVAKVQNEVSKFAAIVARIGTDRARQGLADISTLANQIIYDMQKDKSVYAAPNQTIPYTGGGVGDVVGGFVGDLTSNPTNLILGGVVMLLLLRRR